MRNQKKFSELGNVLQSKVVQPNETLEIFSLEMPKNYVGFIYYLANDYFPLKLDIDGEVVDVNAIIAPIDSPKLFNPPYVVNKYIKVSAKNDTAEPKTMSFCADGIAYSVLTISEETLIEEIKTKMSEPPPTLTEETRPTTASIINHHLNNANQWYEIKIPREVVTWQIRARGSYEILYSFSPTHQTYRTLTAGELLSADTSPNENINAIYVMCETAGVIVELEVWER